MQWMPKCPRTAVSSSETRKSQTQCIYISAGSSNGSNPAFAFPSRRPFVMLMNQTSLGRHSANGCRQQLQLSRISASTSVATMHSCTWKHYCSELRLSVRLQPEIRLCFVVVLLRGFVFVPENGDTVVLNWKRLWFILLSMDKPSFNSLHAQVARLEFQRSASPGPMVLAMLMIWSSGKSDEAICPCDKETDGLKEVVERSPLTLIEMARSLFWTTDCEPKKTMPCETVAGTPASPRPLRTFVLVFVVIQL